MKQEQQFYGVAGKIKLVYEKKGVQFTRKGYSLRLDVAERFAKKCALLNEPEGRMVERLIEAFIHATGWGDDTKQGAFFETRSSEHIKDASRQVAHDTKLF